MMKNLLPVLLLLYPFTFIHAQDTEIHSCSFAAHTPAGTLHGACTTQSQPAPGFIARWKLTMTVEEQDAAAALKVKPDTFNDMVRGQCLEDGSFTTVMPLWGDIVLTPNDTEYLESNRTCAPVYQTAPNVITLTKVNGNPLALEILFEENNTDFNTSTGFPTMQWTVKYLESFQRLQRTTPVQ
jgi:hypothetical protein